MRIVSLDIERRWVGLDWLEEEARSKLFEEGARLLEVGAVAEVEHEGFQAAGFMPSLRMT